jgi:glycosyltransferase involved in cell wall biosynthesis
VHVCMVTPHLPPEQAANALLPPVLARELALSGVCVTFLTHASDFASGPLPPEVTAVKRRGRGSVARSPIGAVATGIRLAAAARRALASADLVHLHSNGFIIDVSGWMAGRLRRPTVITLYGTDVWHFDRARHRRFAAVVSRAAARVFYSQALRARASELGLAQPGDQVIYAPVDGIFRIMANAERQAARQMLGITGPAILTVKRLHDVAGYDVLLLAFADVARRLPESSLFIAGYGELRPELERQTAELGLASRVHFLGRLDNRELPKYYASADLFVLPSRLESWGTVMLEALACGTRVVATATAGASETSQYFAEDLELTPVDAAAPLADAMVRALSDPRRTGDATKRQIDTLFRPTSCASAYKAVYEAALAPRG